MTVTITDFRKNLFRIMDRVLSGESVEVLHRGNTIRITRPMPQSKLSRIVKRDTLRCPPAELEKTRRRLQKEMRNGMEKDWREI